MHSVVYAIHDGLPALCFERTCRGIQGGRMMAKIYNFVIPPLPACQGRETQCDDPSVVSTILYVGQASSDGNRFRAAAPAMILPC